MWMKHLKNHYFVLFQQFSWRQLKVLAGAVLWDRWQKADTDKDGKLSEKEFNDYQKKLMERFKGGKNKEENKKD